MQTHTNVRRRNRVYKSLHKPLTYLGVERTLFFFISVTAVGTFNLFNSLLAGLIVHWRIRIWHVGDQYGRRLSSHRREGGTVQDTL